MTPVSRIWCADDLFDCHRLINDDGKAIQEAINHLEVDADHAYDTSRTVGNDAQELRDELRGIQRDWDNLSRGWSGAASSAYSTIWTEWLEGATAVVDSLVESSHKLGVAAVAYFEQDASSAVIVGTAQMDLGI